MSSYASAVGLGVQGVESTIRVKRSKRFQRLPRVLSSHELSTYWVFRRATISVDPGDCVLVLADVPAMSTTFMRSVCGLLPADEGRVTADGRSLIVSVPKTRAVRGLSVRQSILMMGGLFGMSDREIDERTDEVIRLARVKDVLNQRIEDCPQHIRSQIAFSLAMVAPVDIVAYSGSPIVGDPRFRARCAGRLAQQMEQGKGLLVSTRDPQLARRLCTKAILLDPEESTVASVDMALEELQRRVDADKRQRRRNRRRQRASYEEDDAPGI